MRHSKRNQAALRLRLPTYQGVIRHSLVQSLTHDINQLIGKNLGFEKPSLPPPFVRSFITRTYAHRSGRPPSHPPSLQQSTIPHSNQKTPAAQIVQSSPVQSAHSFHFLNWNNDNEGNKHRRKKKKKKKTRSERRRVRERERKAVMERNATRKRRKYS
ncbi:hypothetical protein BKA81DRAFT_179794 [Phyllosticta paracitricarpa]